MAYPQRMKFLAVYWQEQSSVATERAAYWTTRARIHEANGRPDLADMVRGFAKFWQDDGFKSSVCARAAMGINHNV